MTQPPYEPTGLAGTTGQRQFYRQPWFVVIGGLVAAGVVGAVIGGASADGSPSRAEAATTSSSAARVPTPPETPSPPSVSAPTAAPEPPPTTPAPATTPADNGVDFPMPDVVGLDLQSAQDLVQTYGVFLSVSHDLLGGRNQLVDSNWIVCTQNIAPGQRVTGDAEGRIDFGVVKREETCP